MTHPFLSYAFPATGATASRTLPDRLANVINVKDYGAVGDGSTDDTSAIQAAFDAAWGPANNPHGVNEYLNRPVIFPRGNYITTSTLYIFAVAGAQIIGDGSKVTSITYKGPIPNSFPSGSTKTNLLFTNGFAYSRVQGISFIMTGGNSASDKTVCFNWNWDQVSPINTTQNLFIDVGFAGASWGFLAADIDPVGFGAECDATSFYNCWIDNCDVGLSTRNWNALLGAFWGGRITNCTSFGIWAAAGVLPTIAGTSFANNDLDIQNFGGGAAYIIGCHSTSPNFLKCGGHSSIVGCTHMATSVGYFLGTTPGVAISIDACRSLNGYIFGQGSHYIRDSQFDNPDWLHSGSIRELKTSGPLTFNSLPSRGFQAEGLLVSISDSPTAAWGANVTAGGGANHVWIRWNGSNWTVVGV
jgi:hypothetical protein